MDRAFFDLETDLLRRMTAEQKLNALDAIRRSARLATELGPRLRRGASATARRQANADAAILDDPA